VCREDYDRLSQFVSEKNLKVKSKGKAPERMLSYNDDASSDSDHDAYLARMKAEGEDRDSEDGSERCLVTVFVYKYVGGGNCFIVVTGAFVTYMFLGRVA